MVRIIQIFSLFLMVIFFSCEKELEQVTCAETDYYDYLNNYPGSSICTDNLCNEYFEIWKQIFKENNHISEDYFNNHIQVWRTSINDWKSGASYSICYRIKFDWALAYNCDQFIIKIDEENQTWPTLPLPRGKYLSVNEIRIVTENHAFSSHILKLSNNMKVYHNTIKDAISYLTKKAGVNTLCSSRIYVDETSGNLCLEAHAEYINKYNECIYAKLDIKTRETDIRNGVCFIIN